MKNLACSYVMKMPTESRAVVYYICGEVHVHTGSSLRLTRLPPFISPQVDEPACKDLPTLNTIPPEHVSVWSLQSREIAPLPNDHDRAYSPSSHAPIFTCLCGSLKRRLLLCVEVESFRWCVTQGQPVHETCTSSRLLRSDRETEFLFVKVACVATVTRP